jgi:hypothetical protein
MPHSESTTRPSQEIAFWAIALLAGFVTWWIGRSMQVLDPVFLGVLAMAFSVSLGVLAGSGRAGRSLWPHVLLSIGTVSAILQWATM